MGVLRTGRGQRSVGTSETIEPELINLFQGRRVLKVVLDDVDVVGGGEQSSKGRR